MQKGKQNSGSGSATGAAPAPVSAAAKTTTPALFCVDLAKQFKVRSSEIALLRLDKGLLKFLFPEHLMTAGAIPVSSSSAVAAHTAMTKKVELFNNFVKVRHANIFEAVKSTSGGEEGTPEQPPIQKLMSAPVLNADREVLGVIQISRKGFDLKSAGPDFTLDDLQQLETAAKNLSQLPFLKEE
ncbi:MAG TPA: hypothetical protein VH079_00290 [Terriglobales bacterium]|nr:hypothetical protein [Terriglobales bacterium]